MEKKYTPKDVTISILAYKKSRFLEPCIRSVLAMYEVDEAKVVIATSTPNEWISDMAEKYGLPVIVRETDVAEDVHEEDGSKDGKEYVSSIGADFQFGIDVAETSLVTVAHQDDIYGKSYIVEMVAKMNEEVEKNHAPLIAFCDYHELKETVHNGRSEFKMETSNKNLNIKRLMNALYKTPWGSTNVWWRRRILAFGDSICCPSVMLCKDNLLHDVFKKGYFCNIDWEAWESLSKKDGAFVYVDHALMLHRIYLDSTTTDAIKGDIRSKEDYEMYCKFWPESIAKILLGFYKKGQDGNFKV